MKKTIAWIFTGALLLTGMGCEKDDCVSCIAEDENGIIVAHEVDCNATEDYAKGFRDGFTKSHQDQGHTVTCSLFVTD